MWWTKSPKKPTCTFIKIYKNGNERNTEKYYEKSRNHYAEFINLKSEILQVNFTFKPAILKEGGGFCFMLSSIWLLSIFIFSMYFCIPEMLCPIQAPILLLGTLLVIFFLFLLVFYYKNHAIEFIFNKDSDLFTKRYANLRKRGILVYRTRLSNLQYIRIEERLASYRGIPMGRIYLIYLDFKDKFKSKIKFIGRIKDNYQQVGDYIRYLCKFLGLEHIVMFDKKFTLKEAFRNIEPSKF